MPFMKAVAAELPYLRRYARAVTGAADLGDAAVRETAIETLAETTREIARNVQEASAGTTEVSGNIAAAKAWYARARRPLHRDGRLHGGLARALLQRLDRLHPEVAPAEIGARKAKPANKQAAAPVAPP